LSKNLCDILKRFYLKNIVCLKEDGKIKFEYAKEMLKTLGSFTMYYGKNIYIWLNDRHFYQLNIWQRQGNTGK
jgi:hypothetical protein